MKKVFLAVAALCFMSSSFAALNPCPTVPEAQALFFAVNALPAVTPAPSGYDFYQQLTQTSPQTATAYNYYKGVSVPVPNPLQQVHDLSSWLHTAPIQIDYTQGTMQYRQCVYWGSMNAAGTPVASQVLSIQYSEQIPPSEVPVTLTASVPLPNPAVNDKSYDVQYTINNANGEAAEYSVVAVASLPLGVTLNRALPTTCDVSGGVASLAANQHCIIDLTFNASNLTVGPYTGHVLDVNQTQPQVSLPLILSTTITAAPPPLVPMQLTTQQDIPALVTEGITYNMFYQLHNPNATTASYTLTQYNIPGVNLVTAQTTPCALKVGQLAANASCTIEATFAVTPATAPVGLYNQHIFVLNADGGVTPDSVWLKTIVQHYFAHNVIVFGDSLSDIGNTSLAPYTNDADSGRYTWIQYLAQNALLLPSHDIVASNLLGTQTAVDTNVDYAVGGATTANFPAQLAQYKAQLKQPLANPTTWVFLWMGGNDLLYQITNATLPILEAEAGTAVGRIVTMVNSLVTLGINPAHIVVMNLPNLGSTPTVRAFAQSGIYQSGSEYFNTLLADKLTAAYPAVQPHPVVIDVYHFMQLTEEDPVRWGFAQTGDPTAVQNKYLYQMCSLVATDKKNCPYYRFWDIVHPTTKAHRLIAEYVEQHL